LAVEPEPPAAVPQVLEQLERPIAPAPPQPPRRPRERLPRSVVQRLEQQHLAARRLDRDPRRHDLRVVDNDELPTKLARQVVERAMADGAGPALVDEQA